jgi:hypothetical protein
VSKVLLNFVLRLYDLEGNFVEDQVLTSQFNFCSIQIEDLQVQNNLGHIYKNDCDITLSNILNHPFYFYELFL